MDTAHIRDALTLAEMDSGTGHRGKVRPAVSASDQEECEFPVLVNRLMKAEGTRRGEGRGCTAVEARRLPSRGTGRRLDPWRSIFSLPLGPGSALIPGRDGKAQGHCLSHQLCLSPGETGIAR